MTSTAKGTFDVELVPGPEELHGAISRFELSKHFHGDLDGIGIGLMLSGGNPQDGAAGYVAIETVTGHLHGREGSFALQQFGTLRGGSQTLHYEVVPGSGSVELAGLSGTLTLTISEDGTHHYGLDYDL